MGIINCLANSDDIHSNVKHSVIMIVCLGPVGSGKTLLLKALQNTNTIDDTTTTVATVGTNIFYIKIGEKNYVIREMGGAMAPLWSKYFDDIDKVIYVVDASNLCQISAAGVLLYTVLANPLLQKAKVLYLNSYAIFIFHWFSYYQSIL